MTIAFDSHTHTLMSGHAFSTIEEYAKSCRQNGLEGFATTDHGPSMKGAPRLIYFANLVSLPREIHGVHVLRGVEANIVDYAGILDLPDDVLKRLDVCIASFHDICLAPKTSFEHTAAWLAVIANPNVDIVGHSGRGPYPYNLDSVMKACLEHDKAVEINNHTLANCQPGYNCRLIALACKKYGVKIVVNSDAHISTDVGQVDLALELLRSIEFPLELMINRSYTEYCQWLMKRKPWLTLKGDLL